MHTDPRSTPHTGPEYPHVKVAMVGQDGNAFAIIGRVNHALRAAGEEVAVAEFTDAATAARATTT